MVSAGGAYTLVLVVAHELAGQRDLSTPGVRDRITEALKRARNNCCARRISPSVRGDAQVVNYLARRIVESQGKIPGAPAPAAAAPPAGK